MERIKLPMDDHRDFLAGFLGFVLLGVLIYVGLSASSNLSGGGDFNEAVIGLRPIL